jgi:predicted solute-binding protein
VVKVNVTRESQSSVSLLTRLERRALTSLVFILKTTTSAYSWGKE